MSGLLTKVKENLILEHSADDGVIERFITAAASYAESYQHISAGFYSANAMPVPTEQAVIMLALHFYGSRDSSTGGFLPTMCKLGSRSGTRSIFFYGSTGIGRCDMSFGKMKGFADIIATKKVKDSDGFTTTVDEVFASVRVYREGRHSSQR